MKTQNKKSCLIVDDSRVVRKVARRIVEDLGFICTEAEDGQKAFDACKQAMPDSILLNWDMPVMSGLDFLKKLRQSKNGHHPKIIFCTMQNDTSHIKRALDAGADEYIMKPFNNEIIAGKFIIAGLIEEPG